MAKNNADNLSKSDAMQAMLAQILENQSPSSAIQTIDHELVTIPPKSGKKPAPSSDSEDGFETVQKKKRKTIQPSVKPVNACVNGVTVGPSVEMRDLTVGSDPAPTPQAKKPKKGGKIQNKNNNVNASDNSCNKGIAKNEAIAAAKGRCNLSTTNPVTTVSSPITTNNHSPSASTNAYSVPPTAKKDRIPPVVLREKSKFQYVLNYTKSNSKINLDHTLSRREGEHFFLKDSISYTELTNFLRDKKIQFHSFCPPEERSYRVIIKGIPANKPADVIRSALIDEGFHPKFVQKWTDKSGADLGLTQVVIPKEEKHILDLKYVDFAAVTIEMQKSTGQPVQCYNCQNFGHSAKYCNASPRCLKCAANHISKECPKTKDTPAKCCNCLQAHPANFAKCERRPPPRKPVAKKSFIPAPAPSVPAWNNQGGRRLAQQLSNTPSFPSPQPQPQILMPPPEINPATLTNLSPEMRLLVEHMNAQSRWTAQIVQSLTVPYYGARN